MPPKFFFSFVRASLIGPIINKNNQAFYYLKMDMLEFPSLSYLYRLQLTRVECKAKVMG
jgi:hypothetical protein